ncbi:hypothetical protein NQ318_004312 [Aromia moschata]|uniref:RNase H type-1 domain-containing protein n=1 Tax=Aromia moschata TaxID=1265417 RepID=A0AAV8YTL2_9CUCU|nr:hypothetical protein NQ318_004312 [Aromia moschata]
MTKWMGNWKRNHWTTAKGEPVKNKEELQELERATNSLEDVKWGVTKNVAAIGRRFFGVKTKTGQMDPNRAAELKIFLLGIVPSYTLLEIFDRSTYAATGATRGNEEADRLAREGASRYRPNH